MFLPILFFRNIILQVLPEKQNKLSDVHTAEHILHFFLYIFTLNGVFLFDQIMNDRRTALPDTVFHHSLIQELTHEHNIIRIFLKIREVFILGKYFPQKYQKAPGNALVHYLFIFRIVSGVSQPADQWEVLLLPLNDPLHVLKHKIVVRTLGKNCQFHLRPGSPGHITLKDLCPLRHIGACVKGLD